MTKMDSGKGGLTYEERRRKATEALIHDADRVKLVELRSKRSKLAAMYEEDGAIHTAQCIRSVDIPLIEAAIGAA